MIRNLSFEPSVPPLLRTLFAAEGLTLLGIADAEELPTHAERYGLWLSRGYHGTMRYLEDHAPAKYSPQRLLPDAASLIMVGLNYFQEAPRSLDPGYGRVSRYAYGRDYHKVLGRRLRRISRVLEAEFPGHRFRPFTDATPLAERVYGQRAGLGFTGRNTLLIHRRYGSWFFIGELVSTLRFPVTIPAEGTRGRCPRSCRRCIAVCPTGALYAPRRLDARRCISYLTIEHRGGIDEDLRPLIGEWLFGCDLCQQVCPLNIGVESTEVEDFLSHRAGSAVDLGQIMRISDDAAFVSRFAGTPLKRTGPERLVRNACIVAGNTRARDLRPDLEKLVAGGNSVLKEHAGWALARLD